MNNLRILLALLPVFLCCDNRRIVRLCTCYHTLKTNKSSAQYTLYNLVCVFIYFTHFLTTFSINNFSNLHNSSLARSLLTPESSILIFNESGTWSFAPILLTYNYRWFRYEPQPLSRHRAIRVAADPRSYSLAHISLPCLCLFTYPNFDVGIIVHASIIPALD